jgi:pimeloyl-ACP methyl ester carboxylesterase
VRIIRLPDQTELGVEETGSRLPGGETLIFQHGMGGEAGQPLGYLAGQAPVRVVAVNSRGHGNSRDARVGDCRFDVAADDVVAVADRLHLARFAVGGISLGAGVALNIAVRYRERVSALVLCRPAWLDQPQPPETRQVYETIAELLDSAASADAALEEFTGTSLYRQVLGASPAAAESLRHQITRPGAVANTAVLRGFPADRPTDSAAAWAEVTVPVLVIGHHDDPFHPYSIAQAYASGMPRSRLVTVPSKDADRAGFAAQIRASISGFLAGRGRVGTR